MHINCIKKALTHKKEFTLLSTKRHLHLTSVTKHSPIKNHLFLSDTFWNIIKTRLFFMLIFYNIVVSGLYLCLYLYIYIFTHFSSNDFGSFTSINQIKSLFNKFEKKVLQRSKVSISECH